MRSFRTKILMIFLLTAIFTLLTSAGIAGNVNRIKKEDLKKIMTEKSVSILDTRLGRDWSSSEFKIKGAERIDPKAFNTWSDKYPKENTLVLYCA